MKKLFLSILAVATLASCSKTESAYVDQDQEIKLAPVASMLTKAETKKAIDGTKYPDNEHFTVIGYWANEDAGSLFEDGTTYLNAVDFKQKGLYWAGANQAYYWPKNGSLRFACYSPTVIDGGTLTHELATDTWTATDYVQSNDTEYTIDFMVAQTPPSYTAQTAAENVSVVFEHALSWIEFKVKAENAEAAAAFDVKAITINGVSTKGSMVAKYPEKKWTVSNADADIKPYAVCTDAPALAVEPTLVPNTGVLVIPQNTTSINITFTQNTLEDADGELIEQNLDIPLVLDVNNTPWEAGKHYIYTIIFGLDEILINPSVEDWEDVNVNDVPATEVVVATAQEFAEAVNNASQIRLVDDIVLTQNFHINESLNIDLNGHTITCEIAPQIPFRVNDGATLTIGRGDIVSDDYIVSVNAGGKLVMNEGNYTVSTTVVNVNGGEAYITGGYFVDNSTYNGQYLLNHVDAQKDNGLIEITGGTFVNFNPAEASSENPAMNFVKAGYNVTSVVNADGDTEYTVSAPEGDMTLTGTTSVTAKLSIANGVFDGANNTVSITETSDSKLTTTVFGFLCPNGNVTVKDVTIDGNNAKRTNSKGDQAGVRAIYIDKAGTYNLENVKIQNAAYALNVNTSSAVTLNISNSELQGWTSYGSSTTATFTNVDFTVGAYYTTNTYSSNDNGLFRPQGNTVLTDCNFAEGFYLDLGSVKAGNTVKLDNCKYNGTLITADNIQSLGFIDNYADVVVF